MNLMLFHLGQWMSDLAETSLSSSYESVTQKQFKLQISKLVEQQTCVPLSYILV